MFLFWEFKKTYAYHCVEFKTIKKQTAFFDFEKGF